MPLVHLGAPVGSVLAGSGAFIQQALRYRKMFGGGMRQVGILAAAGLYALEHNVARLVQDHDNARLLAEGLAPLPGVTLDLDQVESNIVIFDLAPPAPAGEAFLAACAEQGLLFSQMGPSRIRAVTHMDVSRQDCQDAAQIAARVLGDR